MSKKGHEIAKIPEDIGKADEEEDDVGDSSGSADGQKNGKDEVDEDNDQGDICVDRQNDLLHGRILHSLSIPNRSEASTSVHPRRGPHRSYLILCRSQEIIGKGKRKSVRIIQSIIPKVTI